MSLLTPQIFIVKNKMANPIIVVKCLSMIFSARSKKIDSITFQLIFPNEPRQEASRQPFWSGRAIIDHAQYNVQLSVTSPFLPSWTLIGSLSNGDNDVKCWQISLELNFKGLYQISRKEKENCCFVFPSSRKREIRHFHVVVEQRGQRNVIQNIVIHVQSCYLVNLNLLVYCRFHCCHCRRCLKSLTGPLKGFIDLELPTFTGSHTSYCAVVCDMLLMLIESTTNIVTGEMTFQHHFQIKRGGLFVMYFMSSLNLFKSRTLSLKGFQNYRKFSSIETRNLQLSHENFATYRA